MNAKITPPSKIHTKDTNYFTVHIIVKKFLTYKFSKDITYRHSFFTYKNIKTSETLWSLQNCISIDSLSFLSKKNITNT